MGSNKTSSSESKPISAAEQTAKAEAGLKFVGGSSALQGLDYKSPEFQRMGQGDYQTLYNSIYKGQTAGIDEAVNRRNRDINQEMGDRGMWASGAPIKRQGDEFRDTFAPMYAKAGADATTQMMGMKQQDTAAQNAYNQTQANQQYESGWRVPAYMQGMWTDSNGVISSGGGGGGWSI